ncbi:ketosteroid isomerase-like protein [Streptomyces sp. B4I13]|nr:ketosteroid isomerase-like protein [Streptomyces sp. B4I13]
MRLHHGPHDHGIRGARRTHRSRPDDESEGAPLYVMTKQEDGRWLLTACQNTGVVAD